MQTKARREIVMRDATLDIMKAIGIILVILGYHTSGMVHQYIYSFHMPMFLLRVIFLIIFTIVIAILYIYLHNAISQQIQ